MLRKPVVLLAVLATVGCKGSILGFGANPADAARHAGESFESHALRFDDVVRETAALLGWRLFDMERLLQRPRIEVD